MSGTKLFSAFCLAGLFALLLAACTPAPAPALSATVPLPSTVPTSNVRPTAIPSLTPEATRTPQMTPSPLPSATSAPALSELCSPLEGEALSDLAKPDLLKNPFVASRPGYDDGHQGVDFAYWTRADGTAMLGLSVHSVLDGRVAGLIHDRQPYGNAVIIETPFDQLPAAWLELLPTGAYDPSAALQPSYGLTCPAYQYTPHTGPLSLYLLYAHFEKPSALALDRPASCGETIGQVGTTGRSVNPHLHFETRIGPSGMSFASMAHYQNDATDDEMRSYCLWRISGAFLPLDPMLLLSIP